MFQNNMSSLSLSLVCSVSRITFSSLPLFSPSFPLLFVCVFATTEYASNMTGKKEKKARSAQILRIRPRAIWWQWLIKKKEEKQWEVDLQR